MLKGILFLTAFALLPWWLSVLVDRMDIPLSPSALLSSWLRDNSAETLREQPPPGWREALYFARNPDVMEAVRRGEYHSGYEHYVRYGRAGGRPDGLPSGDPLPVVEASPVPTPAAPASPPPSPTPEPATVMAARSEAPVPLPPALSSEEDIPTLLPSRKPVSAPKAEPQGASVTRPAAAQVLSIRSAAHAGFVRVVLDSAAALRAERAAQRGPRVAGIELAAGWQPSRQGRLLGKSLSYRVETAGGRTRLLLESGEAIRIKTLYALPPDQPGGRHRLILDVATGG
ncbi:hypothetical protein [Azospirillum agricola]|uniref:hypothetical protein n=1 Tax=Azospirillum agricola TaxID=1720247 RepID=UPI0011782A44|nr:hypothetical protein [Azospirillum agricola]